MMKTCTGCGRTMDETAQFCSHCGRALVVNSYALAVPERLFRPRDGRMIAGVCAGFAVRYGWDVVIVRLVLVLAVILGAGTPVLAYLIAWIVMPNGQYALPPQTGAGPGSMAM